MTRPVRSFPNSRGSSPVGSGGNSDSHGSEWFVAGGFQISRVGSGHPDPTRPVQRDVASPVNSHGSFIFFHNKEIMRETSAHDKGAICNTIFFGQNASEKTGGGGAPLPTVAAVQSCFYEI